LLKHKRREQEWRKENIKNLELYHKLIVILTCFLSIKWNVVLHKLSQAEKLCTQSRKRIRFPKPYLNYLPLSFYHVYFVAIIYRDNCILCILWRNTMRIQAQTFWTDYV
jgi:hypothetical protein